MGYSLFVFLVVAVVRGGAECTGNDCAADRSDTDSSVLIQSRVNVAKKQTETDAHQIAEKDESDEGHTRALLTPRKEDSDSELGCTAGVLDGVAGIFAKVCKCAKEKCGSCSTILTSGCNAEGSGNRGDCKKCAKKKCSGLFGVCQNKCKKILDDAPSCFLEQSEVHVDDDADDDDDLAVGANDSTEDWEHKDAVALDETNAGKRGC